MHWFFEYSAHHLRSYRFKLSSKIPLGSDIIVMVRPEILPLLRDNLTLSLVLLLVLLNPFILINSIHEIAYTSNGLPSQRLP